MKTLTVRIKLPAPVADETAYNIVTKRLLEKMFYEVEWYPKGTAIAVHDADTGALLHSRGSFMPPPPDEESAAEEKGDFEREGGY